MLVFQHTELFQSTVRERNSMKRVIFAVNIKRCLLMIFAFAFQLGIFYFFCIPLSISSPLFLVFGYLMLGRSGMVVVLDVIQGNYLTTRWFREKGIRSEAWFERVKITYQYSSGSGGSSMMLYQYQILARGTNFLTQKQQLFKHRCTHKEAERLREGDRLLVYLHPKRPRWAYRIDVG